MSLDIFQLIEKNPLTRLSKTYQSKFIQKIQNNFTKSQQQIFLASFLCYLNYNSKMDFVIEFESVWKWLGFERKEFCKRVLTKHFIQDIDYKITLAKDLGEEKLATQVVVASLSEEKLATEVVVASLNHGGQNKETILLTSSTFKKLALKSKTKKADEVHDYFIIMEETFQEVIDEESNELRQQLTCNQNLLLENQIQNIREKHETLTFSYYKKSIVYIFKIIVNQKIYYKFGFTDNIKKRINEHRRLMKCDLYLVFCIETKNNVELENKLKHYLREYNNDECKRITLNINNYEYTEIIETTDINNVFSRLISFNTDVGYNLVSKKEVVDNEKAILQLQNKNIDLKIQYHDVQKEYFHVKELEEKLLIANNKIDELTIKLNQYNPIIVLNKNINNIYPNELYEKFISEYCEIGNDYKCSAHDLMYNFKNTLQNTIYQEQINSMYNTTLFTQTTMYFLPSFKKEFFDYFENLLNYKATAIAFRNKDTLKSDNLRGFIGIKVKVNTETVLYENTIYIEFIKKYFIKDLYEHKIEITCIQDLFIKYLTKCNIKQLFRLKTPEFTKFRKELTDNISLFFNIKEQRIQFTDKKSARPGFHYLKLIN